MLLNTFQPIGQPTAKDCVAKMSTVQETSQTSFDTFNLSQHLLHTLHKPFFAFQLHFDLSGNNKAGYAENVATFHLQIKKATQKFTDFIIF